MENDLAKVKQLIELPEFRYNKKQAVPIQNSLFLLIFYI